MLWKLFGLLWHCLLVLMTPIPDPPTGTRYVKGRLVIDEDAPCVACGNMGGSIQCVLTPGEKSEQPTVVIKRTCHYCGAKRFVPTVHELVGNSGCGCILQFQFSQKIRAGWGPSCCAGHVASL